MTEPDTEPLESIWARTPSAFVLAGTAFVVFAALWAAGAASGFEPRPAVDVVGPAGWAAAFVGLLGLYPRLVGQSPWLSRAAAFFAAVGLVGASVTVLANAGQFVGVVGEPPAWFAALNLLLFVGIIPGFFSFAVAVLRTDARSRAVGLLLLAPAALFVLNVVRVTTLGPRAPTGAPAVLGFGQAVVLLAIGLRLRDAAPPTGLGESSSDANPHR